MRIFGDNRGWGNNTDMEKLKVLQPRGSNGPISQYQVKKKTTGGPGKSFRREKRGELRTGRSHWAMGRGPLI